MHPPFPSLDGCGYLEDVFLVLANCDSYTVAKAIHCHRMGRLWYLKIIGPQSIIYSLRQPGIIIFDTVVHYTLSFVSYSSYVKLHRKISLQNKPVDIKLHDVLYTISPRKC